MEDAWDTIKDKFNFDNLDSLKIEKHSESLFNRDKKNCEIYYEKYSEKNKLYTKEFLFENVLNCFDDSIIIHNYAEKIDKEISILPLISAFNSWIDDNIIENDILKIMQIIKNKCKLTYNAQLNFDNIVSSSINSNRSGSKETILKIIKIHNLEKYNKFIDPFLYTDTEILNTIDNIGENNISIENEIADALTLASNDETKQIIMALLKTKNNNILNKYMKNIEEKKEIDKSFAKKFIINHNPKYKDEKIRDISNLERINLKSNFNLKSICLEKYITKYFINFEELATDLMKILATKFDKALYYFKESEDDNPEDSDDIKLKYKIGFYNTSEIREILNKNQYECIYNDKYTNIKLGDLIINNFNKFKDYLDVNGCVFKSNDNKYISVFTGFDFEDRNVSEDIKKIDPFLKHVKEVIADNNEEVYNYIINWIAFIIQNPGKKTGVCLVLIDGGGTGKTIFTDIISELFGIYCISNCNKIESILGQFNASIENKMLIVLNEVRDQNSNYKFSYDSDELKTVITERKMIINDKNIPSRSGSNVANFIICSNNENAVSIKNGDRRFMITEPSSKYKDNDNYFKKLLTMKRYENLEIIYNYLRTKDLKEFNIQHFPKTNKREMSIASNISIYDHFIINDLDNLSKITYERNDLRQKFKEYINENGYKYNENKYCAMIKNNFILKQKNSKKYYILIDDKIKYFEMLRNIRDPKIIIDENDF